MSGREAGRPELAPVQSGGGAGHGLRRNVIYAVGGTALLNACRLGVIVLLAKFTSERVLGQYNFAMALSAPIVLFFSLQLRSAQVSDALNRYSFATYRRVRTITTVAAAAVLAGVALIRGLQSGFDAFLWLLAGVFAAKVAWSLSEICWGVFQKCERLDLVAASNIWRGIALVLPFAVLLPLSRLSHATDGAEHSLAGAAAIAAWVGAGGWLAVHLLFDRPQTDRRVQPAPPAVPADVRRLMFETLPLGLVMLIITLCDSVPQLVVASQDGGLSDLGYFGAIAYISMAGNMLILQTGQAIAHRLSLYYQTDLRAFLWLAGRFVALAAVLAILMFAAAFLFGRPLLTLLYTSSYAEHFPAFLTLVAAQAVIMLVNVFGIATTHMRLFWVQVPVQTAVLAATVVAALLLIPADPIQGAAWTAVVRAVTQAVLYAGCLTFGVRAQWKRVAAGSVRA